MNNGTIRRAFAAAALAVAAVGSQAATMTLTDWRHDDGHAVAIKRGGVGSSSQAGGFEGRLSGEMVFGLDTPDLETYCIELTQTFRFGRTYDDYAALTAFAHFGAPKADRLGRLISHVFGADVFGTASDRDDLSSALQLAIWNVVYDEDEALTDGDFRTTVAGNAYGVLATSLLTGSVSSSVTYDLYVLSSPTAQDQLLWRERPATVLTSSAAVPEPGTLALVLSGALGALALRRGRRVR